MFKKVSVAVRVKIGVTTGDLQERQREALLSYPTCYANKRGKISVANTKKRKIGKSYPTATLTEEKNEEK